MAANKARVRAIAGLSGTALLSPGTILDHLDTATRNKLEKFLAAHHNADARTVINKAVEDFMTSDLAANKRVSDEFGV